MIDGLKITNSKGVSSAPFISGVLSLKNLLFQVNSGVLSTSSLQVRIESCRFENNETKSADNLIEVLESGTLGISKSQFVVNRSPRSLVYVGLGAVIDGCVFKDNNAQLIEIFGPHSALSITNSLFAKNRSESELLALIEAVDSSALKIINSTFYENSIVGDSLILSSGDLQFNDLTVLNSVFWKNFSPRTKLNLKNCQQFSGSDLTDCQAKFDTTDLPTEARVKYSNLQTIAVRPGEGNLNQDPRFKDADRGDFSLLPGSLCLGTGDKNGAPLTNIDGETRSDPPNMGAY